ncbi:MAG: aldo/keto reductase [Candidatus Bathyarchaeia archaeon]
MKYKKLGKSNLLVSPICLGTWEFAQTGAWGSIDIDECKRIVDYALDAGINFIDTAEGYGKSEEILGKLLKGRREGIVLATKIGPPKWDYETMRKRLEGSLSRLQTGYIDLYIIHWPKIKGHWGTNQTDMEDKDYEDISNSLKNLIAEGLVTTGGVSNFRLHHLTKFRDDAFEYIVVDQVPYSLLFRSYDEEDIANFCKSKSLKYLSYSSLAQGLLTGKYTRDSALTDIQHMNVLFNEPIYSRAMKVVDVLKQVAMEVDATPAQVALKWVIERDLIASALVGVKRVSELEENVKALDIHLTTEQMERLDKASLEFWAPLSRRQGLELWLHDSVKSDLEAIGIREENLSGKALASFRGART